jgi:integrase
MAHVEDRWHKTVKQPDGSKKTVRTARYGVGKRWKVRYEVNGRERGLSFEKKQTALDKCAEFNADQLRGTFVDPKAGKTTLREYAEKVWLPAQTFDVTTREKAESRLRVHIIPQLGDRQLGAILPSGIQAWSRGLQARVGKGTAQTVFANLSSILGAAVDDGIITRNPCRAPSVRKPRADLTKVEPWPTATVAAVRAALPERYRAAADFAGGCGLRQGEVFGLGVDEHGVDDIDWLRGVVHVRRQIRIVRGRLVFAPPKGGRARNVPLAAEVAMRAAAHLQGCAAEPVTLPWLEPGGDPVTVRLVFTTPARRALNRNHFNARAWRPALAEVGVPDIRANGMHALRHWYASVQLHGGTDIKALAEYLGHTDAGFTLRTYTHLMPGSADRARKAIDEVLRDTGTSTVPVTSQEG